MGLLDQDTRYMNSQFGTYSPGGYTHYAYGSGYGGALNNPAPGGGAQAPANQFNPQVAQTYATALAKQFNQANQANQNQLNQMMGLAQGYGQGQLAQSQQLETQQAAQGQQTMASRGLYNSTVAQGLTQNAQNQQAIRDAGIKDQQTQLQLGVLGQNQIKGPDLSAYAQLMSQPGAMSGNSPYSAILNAMGQFQYGPQTPPAPKPAGKK